MRQRGIGKEINRDRGRETEGETQRECEKDRREIDR